MEGEDLQEDEECQDLLDPREDLEDKDCQEEREVLGRLEKREDLDGNIARMTCEKSALPFCEIACLNLPPVWWVPPAQEAGGHQAGPAKWGQEDQSVILVSKERLDLEASPDCRVCLDQMDLQDPRETVDMTEIQDLQELGRRDRWE